MNSILTSQFFIAITPVDPLQNSIDEIKTSIYQKYGLKGAFRSPAHITLQMPFSLKLTKLPALIEDLKTFAKSHNPFSIELDGFDCFEPRVIYIKVVENSSLNSLQNSMQKMLKGHQIFNAIYKNHSFHPHITVAFRDLKKKEFYPLWEEYRNRTFNDSFQSDKITLYRMGESSWQIYQEFEMI